MNSVAGLHRDRVSGKPSGFQPEAASHAGSAGGNSLSISAAILEQVARCLQCGTPFCHGYGCPLGNVIPEVHDLVRRGRWREAWELLSSTNPFPEFTGRICPAPCEAACVCGLHETPVTIRRIELAVAERAWDLGLVRAARPGTWKPARVAVVGSGPAGLAAAWRLNRAGHRVTVFERADRPGGLLRYGIPGFKLEKSILDRRLRVLEAAGVVFENGVDIGRDLTAGYLLSRFAGIILAGGVCEPRDLRIPGRELNGIHFALDYLSQQNRRDAGLTVAPQESIDARDCDVVIIGGGDTGADCWGTALRQGARRITQLEILPKPPAERPQETPWPEWPRLLRDTAEHSEAGERRWSVMTKRFEGRSGHVTRVHAVEVDWVRNADGRLEPRERPGTDFVVNADLVILALGFVGPGRQPIVEQLGLETDERGYVRRQGTNGTSRSNVWVAGDMAQGPSLVVRALADGLGAAISCIETMKDQRDHEG